MVGLITKHYMVVQQRAANFPTSPDRCLYCASLLSGHIRGSRSSLLALFRRCISPLIVVPAAVPGIIIMICIMTLAILISYSGAVIVA